MLPLRMQGATIIMKVPRGQEDDVRDLHVAEIDGCSVSRWEPTPAELDTLNAGGSVELWVMGRQPPVFLTVKPHASTPHDR
jgi:hypothetical protein